MVSWWGQDPYKWDDQPIKKLVTYKGRDQICKHIESNGARFSTSEKGVTNMTRGKAGRNPVVLSTPDMWILISKYNSPLKQIRVLHTILVISCVKIRLNKE